MYVCVCLGEIGCVCACVYVLMCTSKCVFIIVCLVCACVRVSTQCSAVTGQQSSGRALGAVESEVTGPHCGTAGR